MFAIFVCLELWFVLPIAISHQETIGLDFHLYLQRARDWLDGSGFYLRQQTEGPYAITPGDSMYPPVLLYILVPMLWLPEVLWWLMPGGLICYAIWRHRPQAWAFAFAFAVLSWPHTLQQLIYGNPILWAVASVAAGTLWGWPYVGAFIKPTVGLFAFLGFRHRSWWVALAVSIGIALPLAPLWLQYADALANARNGLGLSYLLSDLPLAAVPVVAWLGRTTRRRALVATD